MIIYTYKDRTDEDTKTVSEMLFLCRKLDLFYSFQNIETDKTGIKERAGLYGPGYPFMETWDGCILRDKYDLMKWYYNTYISENYRG